mgnify:CR=1 FL=1
MRYLFNWIGGTLLWLVGSVVFLFLKKENKSREDYLHSNDEVKDVNLKFLNGFVAILFLISMALLFQN